MPIFDQGYQHWSGKLSGNAGRWYTITRHGIRVGMKNILLRLLVITSWVPAVGLVVMLCEWGLLERNSPYADVLKPMLTPLPEAMLADPRHYRVEFWTICFHYFFRWQLPFSMLVVLLVGPGLISLDLRFNALPLYFSRPLRRIDYFVGKLGVVGWFLAMVIIFPPVIAYVFGLAFSLDLTIIKDTLPLLLASVAYAVVIVVSAGALILALSSLSRNSRYVALFWIALWFVSLAVGNLLDAIYAEQTRHQVYQRQYAMQSQQMAQPPGKPLTPEQQRAQQLAFEEQRKKAQEEFLAEETRAAEGNWRPLLSYTANLSRLGEQLLRTEKAKRDICSLYPADVRDFMLVRWLDDRYPWYWSAAVLTVLLGLSVCLLNSRVRSLDRLK